MVEGVQEKRSVEQERRPASQDGERVTAKKGKTWQNPGQQSKAAFWSE